jgi:hypothetical protein
MRVFVNAVPTEVEPGTDVAGALRAHDPELAARVAAGRARVTDARGIALADSARLAAGTILRVVPGVRWEPGRGDADP